MQSARNHGGAWSKGWLHLSNMTCTHHHSHFRSGNFWFWTRTHLCLKAIPTRFKSASSLCPHMYAVPMAGQQQHIFLIPCSHILFTFYSYSNIINWNRYLRVNPTEAIWTYLWWAFGLIRQDSSYVLMSKLAQDKAAQVPRPTPTLITGWGTLSQVKLCSLWFWCCWWWCCVRVCSCACTCMCLCVLSLQLYPMDLH